MSKVHFIGIGGIGMSALARVLVTLGYKITGSDITENQNVEELRKLGVEIWVPHDASKIHKDTELVVYSSAILPSNPELIEAKKRNLRIMSRGELLAKVTCEKRCIAIGGSHGKTTTTGMIGKILYDAGLSPTIIVGGRLRDFDSTNALWGDGNIVVTETDESDGSFLYLTPSVSVITNVDMEHVSHYGSYENLVKAFYQFCENTRDYRVLYGDDDILRTFSIQGIVRYGMQKVVNDVVVEEVKFYTDRTSFKVNSPWGNVEVCIGLLGLHNVKNATASITVSALLGIPLEKAAESLGSFKGVERRLTIVGEKKGITLIDDYAHHPTEVKSTLSAIRQRWKDNRVIAIFQPHRYSRMSLLWEEFLNSFHLADEVWVTGVYSAGEVPGGFDMDLFVKKLRDLHGCVRFYESWKDMVDPILSYLKYGDVVVTLGAGDVGKLCKELLKHL